MDLLVALALLVAALAVVAALLAAREARRSRLAMETALANVGARTEEASAAARRERRDRDLVLATMDDGVLLFRADGSTAVANAAVARLLGGRPAGVAALTPATLQEAARSAADEPRVLEVEAGVPPRTIRATVQRIAETGSVLAVLHDVTEATRLDRTRRDFVANASHELKTPVATIRATAETLRTAALEDAAAVPGFAERIESEALRLARIVADLLDLTRLEGGSEIGGDVDLSRIVAEEAERIAPEAKAAGVEVAVVADGAARIRGSDRDLSLLVRNLLDNAIRYASEGGHVRASTRREDGEVVLAVEDDGVGIPTRDLPRVFERFYRVDRGRSRETGGTGLGLAIVRHVAENHGGAARIESELGRGTTVEVRFPAPVGLPA